MEGETLFGLVLVVIGAVLVISSGYLAREIRSTEKRNPLMWRLRAGEKEHILFNRLHLVVSGILIIIFGLMVMGLF